MEKKKDSVGFTLKRIATEQFAIVEEAFEEKAKINLNTNLRFAINKEQRLVGIFSLFRFEQKKVPFLLIEVSCHFQIDDDSWKEFSSVQPSKIVIPKGFMSHLAMLSVGTTRGILHTKTEGSRFNQFILPTINVASLIKQDVSFD